MVGFLLACFIASCLGAPEVPVQSWGKKRGSGMPHDSLLADCTLYHFHQEVISGEKHMTIKDYAWSKPLCVLPSGWSWVAGTRAKKQGAPTMDRDAFCVFGASRSEGTDQLGFLGKARVVG